uniref:Uncharacterized protein n=1 Tax=Anguilla anguilla TaxID=7936 RepID=A0A0E9Q0L5_ANGAN
MYFHTVCIFPPFSLHTEDCVSETQLLCSGEE